MGYRKMNICSVKNTFVVSDCQKHADSKNTCCRRIPYEFSGIYKWGKYHVSKKEVNIDTLSVQYSYNLY